MNWQDKVDHRLRALWERVPEPDRTEQVIRVFVRFTGPAEALRARGVGLGNVAGDIATATLALSDLERIAAGREIVFVELTQVLGEDAQLLGDDTN